ncbi:hypothetical protein B0H16DRAFT_1526938, partial [Mycena metata]
QSRAHAGRRSMHPSYTTPRPHSQTQTHTHSPAHAGRRSIPQNVPLHATTIGDTRTGSAAPLHPSTQIPSRDTKRARRRNIPRALPESVSSTPTSPLPPIPTHTTPAPTRNAKTKALYGTKRGPIHRTLSRRVSSLHIIFSESTAFVLHPRRRAHPPSRGVGVTQDEQQQPTESPQDAASLQIRAMLASVVAQKKQEEAEEARLWALLNSNGRPVVGGERKFGRVRLRMSSDKERGRMCGFE